ncbi:MAG: hypothetical protein CL941_00890 [Desulfobacter sp.]|nr:hypothetical protein [Desulfobacter sp.]
MITANIFALGKGPIIPIDTGYKFTGTLNSMATSVYRKRESRNSSYYLCMENHFETFEQVYADRFERRYGFYRPYVGLVMLRYLDCRILHNGFARVRCDHCGHEYFLADK